MAEIISFFLYAMILLSAVPIGLLIAWLCNDELIPDRKYILITSLSLFIFLVILAAAKSNISAILSVIYMIVILGIMFFAGSFSKKNKYSK
jgi:hypothetical protein